MRGSAGPGRWPQTRGRQGFEVIDPRFVRIVDEELAGFDGTRSKVSLVEIERRVLVRLKQEGIGDLDLPQRITQQYLSMRFAALGHTTKQHKSSTLRRNSGRSNYPATHPGQSAQGPEKQRVAVRGGVGCDGRDGGRDWRRLHVPEDRRAYLTPS